MPLMILHISLMPAFGQLFSAQEVQHIGPFLTEKPFPTFDHPLS